MKILFLSPETPLFPGGGIGVYFHYVVPALEAAGHEVYLLTWQSGDVVERPRNYAPFHADRVHIEAVNPAKLGEGERHYSEMVSHHLSDLVIKLADQWDVDVIESVDFHAPGLIAFRKLQSSKNSARRLLTTFNHGLHEVIAEANQQYPSASDHAAIVAERMLMRISDHLIVPSQASRKMLREIGVRTPVSLVREPYVFRPEVLTDAAPTHNIQFQGRLSLQKGINRLAMVANVINSIVPVGRIDLIGQAKTVEFSGQSALDFLRERLEPELAERMHHHQQLPRQAVLDLMEPGAFAPHLGLNETFSYACVEAIDAGLIPIVHDGNAMFEFLPADLREIALDSRMQNIREMRTKIEGMLEDSASIRARIRAHCQDTLAPEVVAKALSDVYLQELDRKRGRSLHPGASRPIEAGDVTILIPLTELKPNALAATLDSIAAQSPGLPKVILCCDGSGISFGPRIRALLDRLPDLRVISQPRLGEPALLNTLAETCATELALVLRPGQRLAATALSSMVTSWNGLNMPTDALIVPEAVGCRHDPLAHQLLPSAVARRLDELRGQTALIGTSALRSIGFDSTRRNGERIDWAFWLEFDARGHRAVTLADHSLIAGAHVRSGVEPFSLAAQLGTHVMLREIWMSKPPDPSAE